MAVAIDPNDYDIKKDYDSHLEIWDQTREGEDIIPPSKYQLERLCEKYQSLSIEDVNNPNHYLDNRLAVRILIWHLKQREISYELFNRLVEPYDNGYYKLSDGKSTPLWWTKVTGLQKWLGIKKDIAAVRHDLDYFRLNPLKEKADQYYFDSQIALKKNATWAKIEFYALRLFGWHARSRHVWETFLNSKYGTDSYIREKLILGFQGEGGEDGGGFK